MPKKCVYKNIPVYVEIILAAAAVLLVVRDTWLRRDDVFWGERDMSKAVETQIPPDLWPMVGFPTTEATYGSDSFTKWRPHLSPLAIFFLHVIFSVSSVWLISEPVGVSSCMQATFCRNS